MRDVECVLLLFAEHRSLKKANNKKAANNRRHLGQKKPRALFGCDQRFLREDSPVIPVIYDIQNSMLPSIRLLQVKYRNNFPFLVARVLKFGPETIYLVLNMAKDSLFFCLFNRAIDIFAEFLCCPISGQWDQRDLATTITTTTTTLLTLSST